MRMRPRAVAVTTVMLSLISLAYSFPLTIDATKTYQTIDGFGGFGPGKVWWDNPPYYDDTYLTKLVVDLGLTIIRDEVVPDCQAQGGAFNPNAATYANSMHFLKALQDKAAANNEPLKILTSVWSPPGWMKYNGATNGNAGTTWTRLSNGLGPLNDYQHPHVDTTPCCATGNMYPTFADYIVNYIKQAKTTYGVDIYAFGVQNEANFAEPYNSCVYTAYQLRDLIYELKPKMKTAGLTTKIVLPEHVIDDWMYTRGAFMTVYNDTATRAGVHVFAFHGYAANGVNPGGANAQQMKAIASLISGKSVNSWMDETSGYAANWSGALTIATSIGMALKYARLNGWVFWYMCDNFGIAAGGAGNEQYAASKQFYRWIRPGAQMVRDTCSDTGVVITTFMHRQNRTLTSVIVNPGTSAKSITLTSAHSLPASFTVYRSSSTEKCINAGTFASNGTLSVPAQSVVTLYGQNWDSPTVSVTDRGPAAIPVTKVRTAANGRLIGINGRSLTFASPDRNTVHGVFLTVAGGSVEQRIVR